ncbi:RICIN domain-containing protein [Couchioplanes caeruleus]|uniref:RICIN domain-containing protein n=1 Tax=Couchioplanes caeruleus TaxID=56438 RepID=UPI0020BF0592|nr:RICIN domain-containing protein [Couchioplanes caeruleus]UQU61413.1 RICIN domain-containing protein [Couchioplanes caeruleus]
MNPRRKRRLIAVLASATVVGGLGVAGVTTALAATTGTVVSSANGKCLDVTDGSTANGTLPQMWSCASGPNQTWTYGDDQSLKGLGKCLDVAGGATTDGAVVHLWDCYAGLTSQQWTYTAGRDLVNVKSGKCLDIKDNNLADGAKLQIWTCSGGANQKWTVNGATTPPTTPPTVPPGSGNPDLGPNVTIFDPSMSASTIQNKLTSVFNQQVSNQFGTQRYALLFKPGSYSVDANVGFFTQVAGLGLSPDQVTINGRVHAEADWWPDGSQNATQNFWRSAEGLSVNPTGGLDRWAVSQAAPYRRMHVRGNLALSDGGWSSGGFMSDTKIDGQIQSGSQQQWLTRNSQMGSWSGSNWNQVFVGDQGAPANSFPSPPYTTVAQTPKVAEKPYLYVDASGNYQVFVPSVRSNSSGTTWANGTPAGTSLPIGSFYVVKPGDTAASINAALASGKNLLVTPATYHLNAPITVTRANTVVLGLGLNTAANGLVVNGDDVAFYGLFVEHYQQYQTIWNGENGRTYFYQNEMPYDPPNQAAYMNGSTQGWAAYKVADSVTNHQAWGLGSYCYFNVNPAVANARAFEVPAKPGVKFTNMVTVSLGGTGTISHVINTKGAAVNSGHQVENLVSGP